jgi:iron complex outermembrane receptor protein
MAKMTQQFDKTLLAAAVLAASVAVPAQSQNTILEEVVVTAQKREESLQDTAIAISAFSSDMLDDLNVMNSSDYEAIIPSLSVRDSPSRLFIRGVGRVTNSLGTDPGVAVYLDQIYTSEITALGRANSLTTERVEVLRGPQGTLFGRNATGGAVSINSKRPTEEFENHARVTAGDYDQLNWGVSSSGPVSDSLRYRAYAYGNKRDGYIENQAGDDIWNQDQTGLGVQFSWDMSDTLNLWFSYAKDESDTDSSGVNFGGYLISPYNTELVTQDGFLVSESYQWDKENPAVKDPYKVDMSDVLRAKQDNNNKYIAHLTWDLPELTVKYVGSYFEGKYTAENGDLGYTSNPNNRVVEGAAQETESYSHEVQFLSASDGPLQWVGGLYYYHGENEQPYTINSLTADYLQLTLPLDDLVNPDALQENLGDQLQYRQIATLETDSYAAYADANYTFNEEWKLTVGVRYSYDEKEGTENQYVVADAYAAAPTLPPVWAALGFPANCCGLLITDPEIANRKLDDDWDNVSGRIVLDYAYSDDDLLYASISNGYKAGGFRLGSIQPTPSFDEETVLSYEIGYKGTFNDVLRVNAAAYYYDYEDMQVLVPRLTDENLPVEEVINAKKAVVKGFELEATWLATEFLSLMANYSYIDGEYDDFCCAVDTIGAPELGEQDLSGNSLTQAPENKIFFNANYYIPTDSWGDFVPSISYSWVDERQYDVFDTDVTRADDYYRVDAQISWYSPSDDIRVIASARNLTEEETWSNLQRLNANGALNGQINEPRTWAVEVQYDF